VSVCPVCGKGEYELVEMEQEDDHILMGKVAVSHLACVERELEAHKHHVALEREAVQRAEQAEAELEELKGQYDACQKTCLKRDALIDELEALKARRCETCEDGKDNHTHIPTLWCREHESQVYPHESCSRYISREDGES
jgi:hypothetical protein